MLQQNIKKTVSLVIFFVFVVLTKSLPINVANTARYDANSTESMAHSERISLA